MHNLTISWTAFGAGVLLMIMVAIGVATGVSQQTFELFAPPAAFAAALQAGKAPLKIILGLDNIFIALYSALVLMLARAYDDTRQRLLLFAFAGSGVAAGLLDFHENHDILIMLESAGAGLGPAVGDIQGRAVLSMLKWHLAYFAFFALGLILPARTAFEKAFRFSLVGVQLPVGVFYYIFEGTLAGEVLFYARYMNLAAGFIVFGILFRGKRE